MILCNPHPLRHVHTMLKIIVLFANILFNGYYYFRVILYMICAIKVPTLLIRDRYLKHTNSIVHNNYHTLLYEKPN